MTHNLIELLPHASTVQLVSLKERVRTLQVLSFFSRAAYLAMQSFSSKKFSDFDAQVSENLCQIRAYQVIQIYGERNERFESDLIRLISDAKKVELKCETLLKEYQTLQYNRPSCYTKQIDESITLQEFLTLSDVDLIFPEIHFFLAHFFILSRYKLVDDYEISTGIDYHKLCNDLGHHSKIYARKIIHLLQRNVSQQSCQFIFKLLFDLNAHVARINLLKSLYFQDEVGRHVLSCYEATRVLLEHALHTSKYFQVKVKRVSKEDTDTVVFFLQPSPHDRKYHFCSRERMKKSVATIVFSGTVDYGEYIRESKEEYLERFLHVGVENIILANMAQHPQYPGLYLSDKKFNPYQSLKYEGLLPQFIACIKESETQFLKHKYLSERTGCHKNEPTLFLLTHVRPNYHQINYFHKKPVETQSSF